MLFVDKSYSEILTYRNFMISAAAPEITKTEGRANNIMHLGTRQFISDFEGGLIVKENGHEKKYFSGIPIVEAHPMPDSMLLLYLIDTRFILANLKNGDIRQTATFTSPGLVYSYSVVDKKVFVIDGDGFLTVFRINGSTVDSIQYREVKGYQRVFTFDSAFVLWSRDRGLDIYYDNEYGEISKRSEFRQFSGSEVLGSFGNRLFICSGVNTDVYSIQNRGLQLTQSLRGLTSPSRMDTIDSYVYLWNSTGDVWKTGMDSSGVFAEPVKYSFNTLIKDIDVLNCDLSLARYKRGRISSFYDPYNMSNQSRLAFWTAGLKIFADHPLLGVGDIDLRDLYKQYKRPFDKEIQGHMHNNYVHILVTLGAAGFVVFIFLMIRIFIVLYRNIKSTERRGIRNTVAIAALASFIAFLTAGLTEWNFGDHEIITMIWFVVGLSVAAANRDEGVTSP